MRGLEEDIVARVTGLKLLLHLGWQVVVDVLRLPIAVRQPKIVNQRTVDDNPFVMIDGHRMFRHQGPVKLPRAVLKQGLKRGADGSLVRNAEAVELIERGVVVFDGFVGWFKIKGFHAKYRRDLNLYLQ